MISPHKTSWSRALFAGFAVIAFAASTASFAGTSGSFDEEYIPAQPPEVTSKQKPAVVVKPEDKETEATFRCKDGSCKSGTHKDESTKPIEAQNTYTSSQKEACYRDYLLSVAKSKVKNWYGNRPYSAGACAYGVRRILQAAGMNPIGGLGNAIDYKIYGRMKSLGFKNIYHPGMRPEDAPRGAVLVFSGPYTDQYHGRIPRWARAGDFVGHVTIKGEPGGYYYTDGRTSKPAVRRRYLAAVYVPDDVSRFSSYVRRKCGD